jgi:hypothetical protein
MADLHALLRDDDAAELSGLACVRAARARSAR